MTLVDELIAAVKNENIQGNLLLIEFSPHLKEIWLFVEGKHDIGLYTSFARQLLAPGWTIRARRPGNRSSVLRVCREHSERYPNIQTALFFVDLDHSTYIPDAEWVGALPNLFMTDVYSIENWLVSTSCLTVAFAHILGLPEDSVAVQMLVARTTSAVVSLGEVLRPMMAWAIEARLLGAKSFLGNIKLSSFVELDLDRDTPCSSRHDSTTSLLSALGEVKGVTCKPSAVLVDDRVKLLRDEPRDRWLRGKYVGWLVTRVVEHIQAHKNPEIKIPTNVGEANFVSLFAPHLQVPPILASFLRERLPA